MKIDTNAFLQSLPIMGVGLLGIFIVTIVIIIGIYILKALTSKSPEPAATAPLDEKKVAPDFAKNQNAKKESAMDLFRDKEKKDFLEESDEYEISQDL